MITRIISSIFIWICLVYFVECYPSCSMDSLTQCVTDLESVTSNKNMAYGESEEELNRNCAILQGAMQCLNTFARRCMDYRQQDMIRQVMAGPQSMIDDLCTEGTDFRSKYLVHASCFKNVTEDYQRCSDSFHRKEAVLKRSPLSPFSRLRKTCCLFNDFKHCTRQVLLQKCGTEAAEFGDEMLTKAGGELVQTNCAPYTFTPGEC